MAPTPAAVYRYNWKKRKKHKHRYAAASSRRSSELEFEWLGRHRHGSHLVCAATTLLWHVAQKRKVIYNEREWWTKKNKGKKQSLFLFSSSRLKLLVMMYDNQCHSNRRCCGEEDERECTKSSHEGSAWASLEWCENINNNNSNTFDSTATRAVWLASLCCVLWRTRLYFNHSVLPWCCVYGV